MRDLFEVLRLEHGLEAARGPWEAAATNVLHFSLVPVARGPVVEIAFVITCDRRRGRLDLPAALREAHLPVDRRPGPQGLRSQVDRRELAVRLLVHHRERVEGDLRLHRDALHAVLDGLAVGRLPVHGIHGDGHGEEHAEQIRPLRPPKSLQAPERNEDRLHNCHGANQREIHAHVEGDRVVAPAGAGSEPRRRGVRGEGIMSPSHRVARAQVGGGHVGQLVRRHGQPVEAAGAGDDEHPGPTHADGVAQEGDHQEWDDDEVEDNQVPHDDDGRNEDGNDAPYDAHMRPRIRCHEALEQLDAG
mmetsp:Transcript_81798/g.210707  ORF Transcript_81798/g.210707 Transcript_81798/m.210707 type:complete len:303 (+) Transcript_81798:613-1521(+)